MTNVLLTSSWRGTVGLIKPAKRPGSLEEVIRLLPRGIGVIPLFANIRQGLRAEFELLAAEYELKLAELVADGVDIVHCEGAPPFMIHGYEAERTLMERWESTYGVPVFTSGMNQVAALRALEVKRMIGVTYFRPDMNPSFTQYFVDSGFDVLDMVSMDAFEQVHTLSALEIYRFIRGVVVANPGADGIYMMGPGWLSSMEMIDLMERDFGMPVIHPIPAECWEIQKRLKVCQPTSGYGRLLAEMP
jgi:maleate isomerase